VSQTTDPSDQKLQVSILSVFYDTVK